jgi:hypothetical protein
MTSFFVNYRTGDESFAAVTLDNALTARFGPGNVFRDSRSIPPGADFEPDLWRNLGRCTALIVVIGPRWLTGAGTINRLLDPADFVRREIERALELDLPIVPILVGGVAMPDPANLPESIRPLVHRQYRRIHARSAEADVRQVIDHLAETFGDHKPDSEGVTLLFAGAAGGPAPGTAERLRRALLRAGLPDGVVPGIDGLIEVSRPGRTGAAALIGELMSVIAEEPGERLRVAAAYGQHADAVATARRLIDYPVLSRVLDATGAAPLALIAAESLYRIATEPGERWLDKAAYAPVSVDDSTARVYVPGSPRPRGLLPRDGGAGHSRTANTAHTVSGNVAQTGDIAGDFVMGDKVQGDKTEHHYGGRW